MKSGIILFLVFSVLLASCARQPLQAGFEEAQEPQGQAPPPGGPAGAAIGSIELVKRSVRHNDVEVEQVDQVYRDDSLFVHGGGEGLLELLNQLRLRVFNTTELGGITVEELPGNPLSISLYLERGGFTGEFATLETALNFRTPGGATIYIRGTRFFIVYDDVNGVTTAGNFDGSVAMESAGSGPLEIRPGHMRRAPDGQPPGPEIPIPFTQPIYEQRARDLADPVEALNVSAVEQPPPAPPAGVTQPPTPVPPTALQPPTAEVLIGSHCRAGPSQVFEPVRDFNAGVRLAVDGRLADRSWWRVIIPEGTKSCWIFSEQLALSGDLDRVPVLQSPPTPTPPPSPTPTPTPTLTLPPPTEPPVPGFPDLLLVADSFGYCNLDGEGNLIVTVHNGEGYPAGPSLTYVIFDGGEDFQDTPSLSPGASVSLYFSIPSGCFSPDCSFTIIVDVYNDVEETNEDNNSASDTCIG